MKEGRAYWGSLMLLLTAIIWGFAFVAQRVGIDALGPYTFNGVRNVIGGIVLLPVLRVLKKKNHASRIFTKEAWIGGLCCGLCYFAASTLQQYGIMESSVGKASFLTALYVLFVPVLGALFFHSKTGWKVWVAVGIALVGMYLLCMKGGFFLERGDFFLLLCAIGFAVHILVIDYFSPLANGVAISCIQFFTAGILSLTVMLFTEHPTVQMILDGWIPLAYAGVLSCGVAYTLQVVYQKDVPPTPAALILSLESVFGALGGWLILGESMSGKEIIGCILVFLSILIAQF